MAGFTVHATTALMASTGAAAYISAFEGYPLYWGGALCCLGVLGGVLPDIDSNESKIARYSGLFMGMVFVLLVMTQFFSYLISALCLIPAAKIFDMMLRKWTTHRGAFHSLPMCVIFGNVAFMTSETLAFPMEFSFYCAGFLGGGYLFHLTLDEIWSLRKGIRCPSLGTGLQIFRFTFWKSFTCTYAVCGALLYQTPHFRTWVQGFFL